MEIKKRLIVDMDGVLANVYSQFLDMDEKDFGIRQTVESTMGKPEAEVFKNERQYVLSKGFFRNAPLIEGCVEIMKRLNEKYDLFIVSAAMEFPQSLPEKLEWLAEHFPFLNWKQFVFCGSKAVVQGDIMIDDYFKNLDYFKGQTILFEQPHNYGQSDKHHTRVKTWAEIERLLL